MLHSNNMHSSTEHGLGPSYMWHQVILPILPTLENITEDTYPKVYKLVLYILLRMCMGHLHTYPMRIGIYYVLATDMETDASTYWK